MLPNTCLGDVVVRIPQHGACVMCDTLLHKPFVSFFYKQLSRNNDDKVEGVSGAKLRLETNIVLP